MSAFFNLSSLFLFFAVSLLNIIALRLKIGPLGAIFWLLSYFWLIVYLFYRLFYQVKIKKFPILTVISLLCTFAFILFNLNSGKHLGGETTQETSCLIAHLSSSPDGGYNQTCLFGYPARQFYLSSFPSLFGRNLFNLNLGGLAYLVLGLTTFCLGVVVFAQSHVAGDLVSAIFVCILPHSPHFLYLLFYFEQALFPVCLTLICVGLFLMYSAQKDDFPVYSLGLAINCLIFSYTPSLSVVVLGILVLLWLAVQSRHSCQLFAPLFLVSVFCCCSLVFSFYHRSDLRLTTGRGDLSAYLKPAVNTLLHVFFQSQGIDFIDPSLRLWLTGTVFAGLSFLFGPHWFYLSVWMVGTLLISSLSPGFASPSFDFALHRALVILPFVYLAGATRLLSSTKCQPVKLLAIIFVLLCLGGGQRYYRYVSRLPVSKYYQLINWLKNNAFLNEQQSTTVYLVAHPSAGFIPLNDFLTYFFPKTMANNLAADFCHSAKPITAGVYLLPSTVVDCPLLTQNTPLQSKEFTDQASGTHYRAFLYP